jgi:hypothetical protein
MWTQTDDGRRLAVGLMLAMHDRDDEAFHLLLNGVPRADLIPVIESLAEMADNGVRGRMETPEQAREALTLFARALALE